MQQTFLAGQRKAPEVSIMVLFCCSACSILVFSICFLFLRRKIAFDIANISYDANLNLNEIILTIFEYG